MSGQLRTPVPVAGPVGSGRTWTVEMSNGARVSGYLPGWAEDDPSRAGVPLERLDVHLADILHAASFGGVRLPVVQGSGPEESAVVLGAHIQCRPYDDDEALRVPVAYVQLAEDIWVRDLDPERLGEVAAVLRAQADRLEGQVLPALVAARADWEAQRPECGESACGA